MHGKDQRMRALDEMMSGIKTIKYNSLEKFFYFRVKIHIKMRSYKKNIKINYFKF
jgi:hypothetical protein